MSWLTIKKEVKILLLLIHAVVFCSTSVGALGVPPCKQDEDRFLQSVRVGLVVGFVSLFGSRLAWDWIVPIAWGWEAPGGLSVCAGSLINVGTALALFWLRAVASRQKNSLGMSSEDSGPMLNQVVGVNAA